ncbi:MAG TPA: hypothetical protein VMC85_07795 [Desulfomonilaceae bacterium]|nr:hypothetical protein [Desulfomonilaceae bacterium]
MEVAEIIADKNRIKLRTTCVNQDGKQVLDGVAILSPSKRLK